MRLNLELLNSCASISICHVAEYQSTLVLSLSALCMIVACAAFPFGWNSDDFRKICGPEANRFELGLCSIRWAYPLAIIGCVDGVVLATLAFILATRHVRLQPDPIYQNSLYKGAHKILSRIYLSFYSCFICCR